MQKKKKNALEKPESVFYDSCNLAERLIKAVKSHQKCTNNKCLMI